VGSQPSERLLGGYRAVQTITGARSRSGPEAGQADAGRGRPGGGMLPAIRAPGGPRRQLRAACLNRGALQGQPVQPGGVGVCPAATVRPVAGYSPPYSPWDQDRAAGPVQRAVGDRRQPDHDDRTSCAAKPSRAFSASVRRPASRVLLGPCCQPGDRERRTRRPAARRCPPAPPQERARPRGRPRSRRPTRRSASGRVEREDDARQAAAARSPSRSARVTAEHGGARAATAAADASDRPGR
jgi:hypothetical protein